MLHKLLVLVLSGAVAAENGLNAWLRYAPIPDAATYHIPAFIVALNSTHSSPVYTAGLELSKGIKGILGKEVEVTNDVYNGTAAITVATVDSYVQSGGVFERTSDLEKDGFWLSTKGGSVLILGADERGALYGAFEYLSMLAQGDFSEVAYIDNPTLPIRWVNQWDNLDGSIERGYAGPSIFFKDGVVMDDLTRVADYARLMSSVRINGIIINNVNSDVNILNSTNIEGLGRVAAAMRPYGVQIGISLNFASPNATLGTFDPLDPSVIEWWANKTDEIYQAVPDLAGYLVKANSEGQPGPLTYNRTLADGANLFARALQLHGGGTGTGIVMFRAFVYDLVDEADWADDRAKAAVDLFGPLDGHFDDNAVVQVKYGPIDFQVREPASPLFAHLRRTNVALELQVAQEYLGQQCHLVYLPPLWRTVLDFDLRVDGRPSLVRDIISSRQRLDGGAALGGSAAVVNVGANDTWLGSHLAMSNLYAYGRLAWDPSLGAEAVLRDWIRLTFSAGEAVVDTIAGMSMLSWPAYENYTGNLGIQTLTDITGNHYGPAPQAQEGNGYGQWTRAGPEMVGMDRTVWNGTGNGTGYSAQYPPEIYEMFEDLETTPDDLLLWFHHVNWTTQLKSGETVIQHFYDAHYAGAETAQGFVSMWESLRGERGIDEERYNHILLRQVYQAGHSLVWRDAINNYFYNMTAIPDEHGRVMNHPYRIEAEDMELNGYEIVDVVPFEAASGYKGVMTTNNDTAGTVTTTMKFDSGVYDLAVNYFDIIGGRAHWEVFVNDRSIGDWVGDIEDTLGHAPSSAMDESSATRLTFRGVSVKKGDVIRIVGTPEGIEAAPLDYISLLPRGIVD